MNEKKDESKNNELIKTFSKPEIFKDKSYNLKNVKAKISMKKVSRSRNQKGHKNY